MEAGGRIEMYRMMGMTPPVLMKKLNTAPARKLVIDRTGEADAGRYGGLKMNTLMDDNLMGEALKEVQKKVATGESLRSRIQEEDYVQPFAGTSSYTTMNMFLCLCLFLFLRYCYCVM